MTKGERVFVEVVGPPVIGGLFYTAIVVATSSFTIPVDKVVTGFVFTIVIAGILVGIQSILYALIIELLFARGMSRLSFAYLATSTLLGSAAGFSFILYGQGGWDARGLGFVSAIGAAVGLTISLLVRWREKVAIERRAEPGATDNPDDAQR